MDQDGAGEHVHSLPGGLILVRDDLPGAVSPSASSRLPGREAKAGQSDARLTLVVIDQVDAFAGRLPPAWGGGPVARREWVAISSAACWGSTSQGACPPGSS